MEIRNLELEIILIISSVPTLDKKIKLCQCRNAMSGTTPGTGELLSDQGIVGAELPTDVSQSATGIRTFEPNPATSATEEQKKNFLSDANNPNISTQTREFLANNSSTKDFLPATGSTPIQGQAVEAPVTVRPADTEKAEEIANTAGETELAVPGSPEWRRQLEKKQKEVEAARAREEAAKQAALPTREELAAGVRPETQKMVDDFKNPPNTSS